MNYKVTVSVFTVLLFATNAIAQIGIGTTSPNSSLDVRGSLSTNYRSFTANTTAGATDNLLVIYRDYRDYHYVAHCRWL